MERALELRVYERTFSDKIDVAKWLDFRKDWNPSNSSVAHAKCPSDDLDVVVLHRIDGSSSRAIQNFHAMETTMKELGICRYRNVSFGASTPLQVQANIFGNYSLLISPHSSQLRNVIFSHPLSATLELYLGEKLESRNKPWDKKLSAFCVNGLCPTIYNVSYRHNGSCCNARLNRFAMVNIPTFKRDLSLLLNTQAEKVAQAGCSLPWYLKGQACE